MRSVQDIIAEIEKDRKLKAELADSQRNKLVTVMLAAGVATVQIDFSGSGDSGCIDDLAIGMQPGREEPAGLEQMLRTWADTFLEGTGIDWYNNDGGQGSLRFDLTSVPAHFSGDISTNETVATEVQSWDEGAIEDDA